MSATDSHGHGPGSPASFCSPDDADELIAAHADAMLATVGVLEEPPTSRDASAVSLIRAREAGHSWLTRLSSKGHAGRVVEPALLASVRAPPLNYVPTIPLRLGKTGVL